MLLELEKTKTCPHSVLRHFSKDLWVCCLCWKRLTSLDLIIIKNQKKGYTK